jgi:hypothetical protein
MSLFQPDSRGRPDSRVVATNEWSPIESDY